MSFLLYLDTWATIRERINKYTALQLQYLPIQT